MNIKTEILRWKNRVNKFFKSNIGKFVFWNIISILFALLVVFSFYIKFPNIILVKDNEDAVVGIIAFIFTLPVTFSAAFVVIKLGDRMDSLAHQAEVRESFSMAKQIYEEKYRQLKELAKAINRNVYDTRALLIKMKVNDNSSLIRYFAKLFCDQCGSQSESIQPIWGKNLSDKIVNFIECGWDVESGKESALFKRAIASILSECEENIPFLEESSARHEKDNAGKNSIFSRQNAYDLAIKGIKKEFKKLKFISDIHLGYDNALLSVLDEINILLISEIHAIPDEMDVRYRLLLFDNELFSFQETVESLCGLALYPPQFDRINPEIYTDGISDAELLKYMSANRNRLGEFLIEDLKNAWPKKDKLIEYVIDIVISKNHDDDSIKQIRNELNERMKQMPDPCNLISEINNMSYRKI